MAKLLNQEPMVTISLTEDERFIKGERMPFSVANKAFSEANQQKGAPGGEVNYTVDFSLEGGNRSYNGTYYIGTETSDLAGSIQSYAQRLNDLLKKNEQFFMRDRGEKEYLEDLKANQYILEKVVPYLEQFRNKPYKGFANEKGKKAPTVLLGDSPDEIINRIQGWNGARKEEEQFITCNIGSLNAQTNRYENYHKYSVAEGKDISPIYLDIPRLNKEDFTKLTKQFKEAGARYNGTNKKWYITPSTDANFFLPYISSTIQRTQTQVPPSMPFITPDLKAEPAPAASPGEKREAVQEVSQEEKREPAPALNAELKGNPVSSISQEEKQEPAPAASPEEKRKPVPALSPEEEREPIPEVSQEPIAESEQDAVGIQAFTKEQREVIAKGQEAKLSADQIQLFLNPELSSVQMEEIRFAIMDGLSPEQINLFARPEMEVWKMDFCRIGFQHGLSYEELQPLLNMENASWGEKRNMLAQMVNEGKRAEKAPEPENHLASAEMSEEQNYNNIDGMMNNMPVQEPEILQNQSAGLGTEQSGSLENNQSMKEFAKLLCLAGEGDGVDAKDFEGFIKYIDRMDTQFEKVMTELQDIKGQLNDMQRHMLKEGVKEIYADMLNKLEDKTFASKSWLAGTKKLLIKKAEKAVEIFKEKGVQCLNDVVTFLGMKVDIKIFELRCTEMAQDMQASINKVNSIAREMRETSTHAKNIGRAITGKELLETPPAKENGILYRIAQLDEGVKQIFMGAADKAKRAIKGFEKLELAAARQTSHKDNVIPIRKRLEESKEKVSKGNEDRKGFQNTQQQADKKVTVER